MNVSLTPSLEQFVREMAKTGDYNNASEVVRSALRLLKQQETERAARLDNLRTLVREAEQAVAEGEFLVVSSEQELDDVFDKL